MTEYYLSNERWALIVSRLPGKEGDRGCHGRDNRLFIEAVFWIVRTGSPWRSLPPHFGKWNTNYTRFQRWTQKRVWPGVLNALGADESCEYFYEEGAIRHAPWRRKHRPSRRTKGLAEAHGGAPRLPMMTEVHRGAVGRLQECSARTRKTAHPHAAVACEQAPQTNT